MSRASRNSGTRQAGRRDRNGKPVGGWIRAKAWVLVIFSRRDCGDFHLRLRGWSDCCLMRPECTPLVCGGDLPVGSLLNMFKPRLGTQNGKAIGSIFAPKTLAMFTCRSIPNPKSGPRDICHARCLMSRSTETRDQKPITSVQSVSLQSKIHSPQVAINGIKFHSLESRTASSTILTRRVRLRIAYILIVIVSIT